MHKTVLFALAAALLLLAPFPVAADQRDPRLDGLFARLHATKDVAEARALEQLIWSIWTESGDAKVDAEMQTGLVLMQQGDGPGALEVFERMVVAAPGFAEAWNKRATLYYFLGRYEDSIGDVQRTLALEPRHFGALSGLGLIYLETGRPALAIEWMEKALSANPHLWILAEKLKQLRAEQGKAI